MNLSQMTRDQKASPHKFCMCLCYFDFVVFVGKEEKSRQDGNWFQEANELCIYFVPIPAVLYVHVDFVQFPDLLCRVLLSVSRYD